MGNRNAMSQRIKWSIVVLAIIGAGIMTYLVSLHFSKEANSFCNLGEGLSCDIVNKSLYSAIFGIPISVLGLLYFLGILGTVLVKPTTKTLKSIVISAIVFLGPSIYLSMIEYFVIDNICIFCELSKLIIITILILAWKGAASEKISGKAVGAAIFIGIMLAWATFTIQGRSVPEGKYDTLVQCLYDKGFRMYGSKGCSYCAKQREIFGSAIEKIHEIECDPRFPNPQTELCVKKAIKGTPTWILEDKNGNDVTRLEPGVQSPEKLAEVAACPLPAEN